MREMVELLVLDLVEQELVTDQMVLTIGYDIENLTDPKRRQSYRGEITTDSYGRAIPKQAHGSINLGRHTSSTKLIMKSVMELFDRIADENLLVRRINLTANRVTSEAAIQETKSPEQLSLFMDYEAQKQEEAELEREKRLQKAALEIRKRYGKNAILKGINLEEGATTVDRNRQIGGHKA